MSRAQKILSVGGKCLEYANIRGYGLRYDDAVEALRKLHDIQIPILGGDVYSDKDGQLRPVHRNWYCNRIMSETPADFADRSYLRAVEFLVENRKFMDEFTVINIIILENSANG